MDLLPRKKCPTAFHVADWEVRDVSLSDLQSAVRDWHYAGRGSNTATYAHGLFLREDNHLYGIAWWIPPTRAAAEANYPEGAWQKVLALSRLCCDQEVPTNGESFLIGRSIRRIRADKIWECLITYADQSHGHAGGIYKATNWEYRGETAREITWVDGGGRMVSRKAGPVTRTRDQMRELGYHEGGSKPKHRFRMIIK